MPRPATLFLSIGIVFLVLGALQLVPNLLLSPQFMGAVCLCTCAAGGGPLWRVLRDWRHERRSRVNMLDVSKEAADLIPMLYGSYTPYVVEAAERLGAARETTAVPALMHVLEQTVNMQPPGWCDTAAAMVVALGNMGDRRALPLLQKLSNVRGIGLLTVVQEAIDRIEPETSLLRPGSVEDIPQETLLRPADSCIETDPATLLRADNSHS